jgi:EpsD family peptidyl-prolyl cis-trans isomerase
MTAAPFFSTHSDLRRLQRPRFVLALLIAVAVFALAACDKKKDKVATQAAARVNGEEITVHQINQVLEQQQRTLSPAQAASASRQVLARLVDQELAVQEAQNRKLDRDPQVVRQLEAARREIIARAYLDRIGSTVARPTAEDVKKYYDANPGLFSERRVYNFEEVNIEAKPEQFDAIKAALQNAKDAATFVSFLKNQGFKYAQRQSLTPAERLPLDRVSTFAQMKDGQANFMAIPGGAQVLILSDSRVQPVSEEQARPMIEQYMFNERRQKAILGDLGTLRSTAKIEYLGDFAQGMPPVTDAPALPSAANRAASDASMENALKGLK